MPLSIMGKNMDNKDKIIWEQREEIRLLNEEIKCLQLLLSQAGIPYGKGIQEKERPAALQKDSVMSETETVREQFIIPETITQKHRRFDRLGRSAGEMAV